MKNVEYSLRKAIAITDSAMVRIIIRDVLMKTSAEILNSPTTREKILDMFPYSDMHSITAIRLIMMCAGGYDADKSDL